MAEQDWFSVAKDLVTPAPAEPSPSGERVECSEEMEMSQGADAVLHPESHAPRPDAAELATWVLRLLADRSRVRSEQAGEVERRDGWQSIETAPRDGTEVLAWMVTRWAYEVVERAGVVHWTYHNGGGWVSYHNGTPLYWQPLPEPPQRTEPSEP